MEERKDLSGPYKPKLDLNEMSKEFLVKLLGEWQAQYAAFQDGLFEALLKRVSLNDFRDIMVEACRKMYHTTMPRLNMLAKIEPKTFLDYNTVGMLSLDAAASKDYFVSEEEIIGPNHVISTVKRCPYLDAMEESGAPEEIIKLLCDDIEAALMPDFFQNNPKLKITPLKLPPRKSKDEIACKFEFKIEE